MAGIVDKLHEFSARATKNSDNIKFKNMMNLHSKHISKVCDTIAPKITELEALEAMIIFAQAKSESGDETHRTPLSEIDFNAIPVKHIMKFKPLPANMNELMSSISNADDCVTEYFIRESREAIEDLCENIELAERIVLETRPLVEKDLASTSAGYYREDLDIIFSLD